MTRLRKKTDKELSKKKVQLEKKIAYHFIGIR
jgi:hypothetical protein